MSFHTCENLYILYIYTHICFVTFSTVFDNRQIASTCMSLKVNHCSWIIKFERYKLIHKRAKILLGSQLLRRHSSVIFEMTLLIGNKQIASTWMPMKKDELLLYYISHYMLMVQGCKTLYKNSKYFARNTIIQHRHALLHFKRNYLGMLQMVSARA